MRTDKVVTRRNTEKAIARIESFSDSVFGFAITLLVLDLLQIPHPAIEQNLIQSFLTHWQSLLAFLVGFCTILICWISHHHFFCYLIRYDAKFLWLNGILLLIITFTPLPTSIFAEFILRENNFELRSINSIVYRRTDMLALHININELSFATYRYFHAHSYIILLIIKY